MVEILKMFEFSVANGYGGVDGELLHATGAEVGFDKRLADIGQRYGVGSLQYLTAMNTIEWLTNNLSNYKH